MRGILSFDMLIGLVMFVLLLNSVVPNLDRFKEAFHGAACSFLKDLYGAEQDLSSSLNFTFNPNYTSGPVSVVGSSITVMGERCP